MIKALKWAYEMGAKHERMRLEKEIYDRLGTIPQEPPGDILRGRQIENHYRALDRWLEIELFLNAYFGRSRDYTRSELDDFLNRHI